MKIHEAITGPTTQLIRHIWQPGNCTRYSVLLGKDPDGRHLLVLENRGYAMSFGGPVLAWHYMAEKLPKVNNADIAALLGLVEHLGLAEVIYPDDFVFPGVRPFEVDESLVAQVRPVRPVEVSP